mmetsp:Transcript_20176/g.41824  ORF Transcript_20176/g.41824 Transcript_20176/m.41824 type:complete len:207 (+) Transcript_20176:416-1036(+)
MATTKTTVSSTPSPKPNSCESELKFLNSRKNTAPVVSCAIIASVRYTGMTNTASPLCSARFRQWSSVGAHSRPTPTIAYASQQYHGPEDSPVRDTAPATISAMHLNSKAVYPAETAASMAQDSGTRICLGASASASSAPGRTTGGEATTTRRRLARCRPDASEHVQQMRQRKQAERISTSGLRNRMASCTASPSLAGSAPPGRGAL